ncbi:alpha/beta fold hydrolase [Scytonema hofmannii FACHB-248]|uniref:Alpha/beta fold hydrolase n=1 Tax=Scytonema hofmannii FACHB-248 TaxID=1842502 RepID=A0ABR8GU03_9CYAN|nr:alpha/beta fold hydrolase [Scytonema hofmannii FACHB-248]
MIRKSFSTDKRQEKRLWGKTSRLLTTISLSIASSVVTLSVALTDKSSVAQTTSSSSSADFLKKEVLPPLGANNPDCRPDADHPVPVVLVHGTALVAADWDVLSPLLAAKGYCVYALNYGNRATNDIKDSAQELKVFVDNVLALTGASKVSIVGHSQGGMMPRYYIKFLGGANKVDDLIGLSPSNYGSTAPNLTASLICLRVSFPLSGPACTQQSQGSPFLTELNAGDDAPGPVSYTVVGTKFDEIIVPYTNNFLRSTSERVRNITLQDYYPLDLTEHAYINKDLNAFKFVYDALANPGPANPERAISGY